MTEGRTCSLLYRLLTSDAFFFCLIEAFYLSILVYVNKKTTRIWTLGYKGPCSYTVTITLRFSLGEFRLSLLLMFIVVCFMGVYNRIVAGAGRSCAKPYTKTAKLCFQEGHTDNFQLLWNVVLSLGPCFQKLVNQQQPQHCSK